MNSNAEDEHRQKVQKFEIRFTDLFDAMAQMSQLARTIVGQVSIK